MVASVSALGQIKSGGVVYGTMEEKCGIADKMIRDSNSNPAVHKGSRLLTDYWWIPSNSGTGYTKISRGYRLISSTGIDRLCIGPCACGITSEYEEYIGSRLPDFFRKTDLSYAGMYRRSLMSKITIGSELHDTCYQKDTGLTSIVIRISINTDGSYLGSRLIHLYLINFLCNIYTLLFFPSDILTI